MKKILLLTLALFIIGRTGIHAEMQPIKKIRAGTPPFAVISKIIQSNVKATPKGNKKSDEKTIAPYLTWLTDTDPAIRTGQIMLESEDRVFVVRNIGNQFEPAVAAIDYGVLHLHTPALMVTTNSGNISLRQLLEGIEHLEPDTRTEFQRLRGAIGNITISGKSTTSMRTTLHDAVEANIDYQVDKMVARYQKRILTGRLIVVGSVIDSQNDYGRGRDRLIIININGDRDSTRLRRHQAMAQIPPNLLMQHVGRERQ